MTLGDAETPHGSKALASGALMALLRSAGFEDIDPEVEGRFRRLLGPLGCLTRDPGAPKASLGRSGLSLGELREDLPRRGLAADDVLERAPERDGRFVAVGARCPRGSVSEAGGEPGSAWAYQSKGNGEEGMGGPDLGLPLGGWRVGIKDNIHVQGMPSRCGSRALGNFVPPRDAAVVEALRRAGARIVGKTAMDEFAMGSSGQLSAFGPVSNPRRSERVAGGSSSGSAAVVASGEARIALGSDTGGSVRLPAACCGVFGLKPSYGAVSRRGLVAFASSLDCVGMLGATLGDTAAAFAALRGSDAGDSTSRLRAPNPDAKDGLRVARDDIAYAVADARTRRLVDRQMDALRGAGYTIVDVPGRCELKASLGAYTVISSVEAWSNLARFDGSRFGHDGFAAFGPEVVARLGFARAVLDGRFGPVMEAAEGHRQQLRSDARRCFEEADVLLGPTMASEAPFVGQEHPVDPDLFLVAANLGGFPALSVPAMALGEPDFLQGIHLSAAWGRESWLFQVAESLSDSG